MFFPPIFFTLLVANIFMWLTMIYYPGTGLQKEYAEIQATSLALLSEKNDYAQNFGHLLSASGLAATLESHNQTANFSFAIRFTSSLFPLLAENWLAYEEFAGNSTRSSVFCPGMKSDFSANTLLLREEATGSLLNISTGAAGTAQYNSTRTKAAIVTLNETGHVNWLVPPSATPSDVLVNITTANESEQGWVASGQAAAAEIGAGIGNSAIVFVGTNLSLAIAMPQTTRLAISIDETGQVAWHPASGYETILLNGNGAGYSFPALPELSGPIANGSFSDGLATYNFAALNVSSQGSPEYDALLVDSNGDKKFGGLYDKRFVRRKEFLRLGTSLYRIERLAGDGSAVVLEKTCGYEAKVASGKLAEALVLAKG